MESPRPRPSPAPIVDVPRPRSAWRALAGSFRYAWYGILETALRQRNMRIHLVAALWVGLFGAVVPLGVGERLALLLCVFLVISAEVANSALEALVDLVTRERNELARIAKDAGAGAVLVLATCSVAVVAIVALRALPVLADRAGELVGLAAVGAGLTVALAGLLVEWERSRVVDGLLGAAGVVLLVPVALRAVSAPFVVLSALVLVVAVAVARARRGAGGRSRAPSI